MFESLEAVLQSYGYIGLFFAGFLASTILPFGSEGILMLLVHEKLNIPALVITASLGNFLGACTSYYIGYKGRDFILKYQKFDLQIIEKTEIFFSKYGFFVLLFTWLPLIGDAFAVVGGLLRLKFWVFSVLVFTGKFLRYLAVASFTVIVFS